MPPGKCVLRRTLWGGSQETLTPWAELYTRTRELTPTTRASRHFLGACGFHALGVLQFDVALERGEQSLPRICGCALGTSSGATTAAPPQEEPDRPDLDPDVVNAALEEQLAQESEVPKELPTSPSRATPSAHAYGFSPADKGAGDGNRLPVRNPVGLGQTHERFQVEVVAEEVAFIHAGAAVFVLRSVEDQCVRRFGAARGARVPERLDGTPPSLVVAIGSQLEERTGGDGQCRAITRLGAAFGEVEVPIHHAVRRSVRQKYVGATARGLQ